VLLILTLFLDRSDLGWRASETLYILNKPHKHRRFKREREFHLLMQFCSSDEQDELVLVILTLFWTEVQWARSPRDKHILNNPHKH